ncbi:MAG: twin-arginine translocase TatA/TatE family subunit [Candidatus Hydrogenedentota bacterium]
MMMAMPGFGELMIFMVIVLVIFGTSRVASAGKHLGTAIREFKSAVKDPEDKDKGDSAGQKAAE